MARILGLSAVQMGRLAGEGLFPGPVKRGVWDVIATTNGYLAHVRATIEAKHGPAKGIKSEELRLLTARRLKTEAEHAGLLMKNDEAAGATVRVEAVSAFVAARLATLNAHLLAIGPKLAPLVRPDEPAVAQRLINQAVGDALDELNAEFAAGGSGGGIAALGDVAPSGEAVSAAAADPDGERVGGPVPPPESGRKRRGRPVSH